MFKNFSLICGIFALSLFAYPQQQGWNLFDHVPNPGTGGSSGISRVYHK